MKRFRHNILLLLVTLICVSSVHAEPIDSSAAIALAQAYTRFDTLLDKATGYTGTGTCVAEAVSSDCIPYAEATAGDSAWKVTFDGVKLWSEGSCATPTIHDVYVDATDGRFLYSVKRRCDQSATSELEIEAIAFCIPELLRGSYYEFISYVDSGVTVPLSAAFQKAAYSHPCRSRSVISYLLRIKGSDGNEFNAWLITGVDGPASDLAGPDGPARETWLTMVNAESGEQMIAAQLDLEACARSKSK